MSFFNRVTVALGLSAVLLASAHAATNPQISARPQARIVDKVDNTKLTTVAHSTPGRISSLTEMGRVASSTRFDHMMLVLKPSDEQEFALQGLLDQQQDKSHGNYHKWMTPDSFGAAFGVASSDIAQVSAWLQDSGFTVEKVAKGARIITFSGTSGQVEAAFHTEMHNYMVNGELRISNSMDISIPTALASVVVGPSSLNNFRPVHSLHALQVKTDGKGNVTSSVPLGASPDTSVPGGGSFPSGHFVGGSDLATIYDTNPLFAQGIQGQGVTIGIMGQTDVLLSDIQIYRAVYGLPLNNYTRVQIGTDPGIIADDGESDLDLEVSGAMAPLANQIFYTSGNSAFGGGVDTSMEYVVEDNAADVISESYGECEYNLGAGGNAFYAYVYEQAAAQGQSIFISTGDDGPDTCGTYYSAANPEGGYSVNGLGSTPYNVAVGGTQFNEGATYNTPSTLTTGTPYWGPWNTAVPYESALSFIPDQPWNESYFGTGTYGGLTGGGGGISFYYGTPSWQVGPGVPIGDPAPPAGSYEVTIPASDFVVPGPHRYMPDVSLNAAVYHDGTVFCSEGSCTLNSAGQLLNFGIVGGTSVAAPTMAGAQALIDQKNGGRQGNPNYYYYRLAAVQSKTACVASNYIATAGCAFHDSQAGNTDVPAARNSTTLEIGWNAGPQYDLAVGLDSPDVANLATSWGAVSFNATTTSFTISPVTGAPGGVYNITVKVAPVTGTGVPTGDVGIIAQALYGGLGWITLSGGTGTAQFSGLPGGTYCIYAHYGGSTVYGGSNSPCTTVTISTATPLMAGNAGTYNAAAGGIIPATNFAYGTNIIINEGVNPSGTGLGIPSGNVTFTLNNGTANLTPFVANLNPNGTYVGANFYAAGAFMDSGIGVANADIASNYPILPVGVYSVTAAYAGDSTFNATTATPFTFVVGPVATTFTLRTATATIVSATPATVTAVLTTVAPTVGGVPATGTVTFTDTTTGTALGSGTLTGGAVTFTTSALITAGPHLITAVYSGDTNYSTRTATTTITVGGTASTTTLTIAPATAQVGTSVTLTGTAPSTATTGAMYFYDGTTYLGNANISATTHSAALAVATFTAATHPITVTYSGNTTATVAASTSATTNLVITPNTPSIQMSNEPASSTAAAIALAATLLPSPNNVGRTAPTPAPINPIQFLDGTTVLGSAPAIYQPGGYEDLVANFTTPVLKPGYHTLSAVYPTGDPNYATATSNAQAIAIGITTLSITSSTTNVGTNIPFTLTGYITPVVATKTAITGTVTFYDGAPGTGTVIGTANVSAGVATLTTAKLTTVATHTVSAVYSGDTNFYTSTTTTGVNIVAVTPGFTIAVTPTALTIVQGNTGSVVVTATSFGNYSGVGAMSCLGLPATATCTFIYPTSVPTPVLTFTGVNGTQTSALTITTFGPNGPNVRPVGFLWLPALLLAGLLGLRRKQLSMRGRQLMVLAILLCGAIAVSGCSSGGTPSTPKGTYTVTVIANGVGAAAADPNIQPTATITLTVQ